MDKQHTSKRYLGVNVAILLVANKNRCYMKREIANIVLFLRTNKQSPYRGRLSLPYSKTYYSKYSRIAPSIKKCVNRLNHLGILEEYHKLVFLNYLMAIRDNYNGNWNDGNNPLYGDVGFIVLIDALNLIIKRTSTKKDFSYEFFNSLFTRKMSFDPREFTNLSSFFLREYIGNKIVISIGIDLFNKTEAKH